MWGELQNMSTLPTITKITTEIAEYLTALDKQEEDRRLFQFLNGLDNKEYGILRSNVLMMDHLPSVETIVSLVLQEEMQVNNLKNTKVQEYSALMIKGESEKEKCVHCGRDNHRSDMCWEVRGYPVGHPKHKKTTSKTGFRGGQNNGYMQQRNFQTNTKQQTYRRSVANAKSEPPDLSAAIGAATLQLENLLKMGEKVRKSWNVNPPFTVNNDWIVDSGATNHMTSQLNMLKNVKELSTKLKISLPDGRYVYVTHKGDVDLDNSLMLKEVLYVPGFKQSLMSVQKLAKEKKCYITFFDSHCCVQGCSNGEIRGTGRADKGLYYYKNHKRADIISVKSIEIACNQNFPMNRKGERDFSLWHNRLGHAPISKFKHIMPLNTLKHGKEICLVCPTAKFTKSPYPHSQTTVDNPFDLIHIDI
ncbi:hypothetical protein RND81_08G127100 [Saponaria officinalis]|uniref:Retrovirus-related Pol polyprotein from transposon TNT 1-94-like beta-barrel domain-containing protein n=1 Tax=Saponaria officinalis TaxID=3572 RepID=A0AAW1J6X9_SAPOF